MFPDEASISCKIQTQVADLVDNYDVTIHLQDVESIRNNAYNLLRIPFGYSRPRSPDVTQDNQRMPAMEPQRKKLLSSYLKDIGHQLVPSFFQMSWWDLSLKPSIPIPESELFYRSIFPNS